MWLHTEACSADEGEHEGASPGQHHVGPAAQHAQHVPHGGVNFGEEVEGRSGEGGR